jgi:hypothetical protein
MKSIFLVTVSFLVVINLFSQNNAGSVDKTLFFKTDTALNVTLSTNIGQLIKSKTKSVYLPATFSTTIADSVISEDIRLIARGHTRKDICYLPPVKLEFHNATSPKLFTLNALKLVCPCQQNSYGDQMLLKEFLIYKIYNLLTEKSFRVRLLNLTYEDKASRKKPMSSHAFLIEDLKSLAKRNSCKELKDVKIHSERTDRKQMTMVAIFEYMIGNTDWSVPAGHNTVSMRTSEDSTAMPFVVPYDFDYSGLVDIDYAVPSENIEIQNVRERLYRGYPRSMEELIEVLDVFKKEKEKIYTLITNFKLLNQNNRDDILGYLDEFFDQINRTSDVKSIFIGGARRD